MLLCLIKVIQYLIQLHDLESPRLVGRVILQPSLEVLQSLTWSSRYQQDIGEVEQTLHIIRLLTQDLLVQRLGFHKLLLLIIADSHVVVHSSIIPFDGSCLLVEVNSLIVLVGEVVAVGHQTVCFQGLLDLKRVLEVSDGPFEILKIYHAHRHFAVCGGRWLHFKGHFVVVEGLVVLSHCLVALGYHLPTEHVGLEGYCLLEVLDGLGVVVHLHLAETQTLVNSI